jgi:hypothetical protein
MPGLHSPLGGRVNLLSFLLGDHEQADNST